jgi:hypothetical protein
MRYCLLLAVMTAALAGCGGKVVVDLGGSVGSGGAGTGGAGTAGSGGTTPPFCGGKQGYPCPSDAYCQWDPPGLCSGFDNAGVCVPKPGGCPADCPGVCGCDGLFYCNACGAHAAGVDVSNDTSCVPQPDAQYAAYTLPTDAPRYVILKKEPAADRCVAVFVAGFGSGFPDVQTTMGWSVERIGITPHAADCDLGSGIWPSLPGMIETTTAKGSIKQDSTGFPCNLSFDVTVGFPGAPAWVPPVEQLTSAGLVVLDNGCLP